MALNTQTEHKYFINSDPQSLAWCTAFRWGEQPMDLKYNCRMERTDTKMGTYMRIEEIGYANSLKSKLKPSCMDTDSCATLASSASSSDFEYSDDSTVYSEHELIYNYKRLQNTELIYSSNLIALNCRWERIIDNRVQITDRMSLKPDKVYNCRMERMHGRNPRQFNCRFERNE